MHRYLPALALLAGLMSLAEEPAQKPAAPAALSPSPSASPAVEAIAAPSFPAKVELVTVDAVITDKKGVPITGLTQNDFVVTEDGQPQTISSFEAIELPQAPSGLPTPPKPAVSSNQNPQGHSGRTFVILFDDVHMAPFQATRAKTAVAQFLDKGVREGDRVSLVSAGGDTWWTTRMEAGRDELKGLLKRLTGRHIPDRSPERMSDYEAMRIQVYGDAQVANSVNRRFQTYGATPDSGGRGSSTGNSASSPTMDTGGATGLVYSRAAEVYYESVARNRITLDIMERVLNSLAAAKGRKSLILVSEGFIYDTNLPGFRDALQAARRGNCAIYFLDTRGLTGLSPYFGAEYGPALDTQDLGSALAETMEESAGAESLSADSGGFIVHNTNDLSKGIQQIADENRVYYLLGYYPTNAKQDGRFRKIDVKVPGRKGIEVRARKGYYAPLEGGKQPAPKEKPGIDPAIQTALDSPYELDDIPLRMSSYVFDEGMVGKANVLVTAEVDVRRLAFEEKDGRFQDTVEFLMIAAHRETGEYFKYDGAALMKLLPETRAKLDRVGYPIACKKENGPCEFELAPGGYQVKLVVRDKGSGKIGTLVHEFDVPDLTAFRTSSLVLTDIAQNLAPKGEKPAPYLVKLARRHFATGAPLFAQFEVFNAQKDKATGMPNVSSGYDVHGSDGSVFAHTDLTQIKPTSLGRLMRMFGTSLEGAKPGDYELVLHLKDELAGKELEIREPFTVEPAS